MLCNEYGLRFELGPEQLHLTNIYSSKVLYIYCRIDVLCLHFFLSLSNEFSCFNPRHGSLWRLCGLWCYSLDWFG